LQPCFCLVLGLMDSVLPFLFSSWIGLGWALFVTSSFWDFFLHVFLLSPLIFLLSWAYSGPSSSLLFFSSFLSYSVGPRLLLSLIYGWACSGPLLLFLSPFFSLLFLLGWAIYILFLPFSWCSVSGAFWASLLLHHLWLFSLTLWALYGLLLFPIICGCSAWNCWAWFGHLLLSIGCCSVFTPVGIYQNINEYLFKKVILIVLCDQRSSYRVFGKVVLWTNMEVSRELNTEKSSSLPGD